MREESSWSATVLLCDHAQVADGKLYVLGGGWSVCGPGPFVHALAIKLHVPWSESNRKHQLQAKLLDEDGEPVGAGGVSGVADAPQGVTLSADFEVGRPPGLPAGTFLDVPLAVNMGPMELPPGRGFVWEFTIDDSPIASLRFRTRAAGGD